MIWLLMVGCMGKVKLIHLKKIKNNIFKKYFQKIISIKKKFAKQ